MKTQICKECGCIGKPSKTLLNDWVSFDDFGNDAGKRGTTQSRHGAAKEVDCLKCPNCGHSWIPEKSEREKAIEWWNGLSNPKQHALYLDYFGCRATDKFPDEIEQIWRKETQQESFEDISADVMREYKNSILKEKRSQVDFEMLRDAVFRSIPAMFGKHHQWGNHVENLQLFFELLSKSSTFAHKAHKELNKLMK